MVRDIYKYISSSEKKHFRYGLNPKRVGICIDQTPGESETERMVNGQRNFDRFIPT